MTALHPAEVDRVSVTGIEARAHHGVLDHERRDGQRFRCDVTLHVDTRRAASRDRLAEAVDYGLVAQAAHGVLGGPPRDLVETVASDIATAILTGDERVLATTVAVSKPDAPIPVPFGSVAVRITRTRQDLLAERQPPEPVDAVVGIGSNTGDRAGMLLGAVHGLAGTPGVSVRAVSAVVDSPAVGVGEQPDYLNAVVLVRTSLSPLRLLHACQDVETEHGRRRGVRWGPRTLDVDVVSVGDTVLETATLTLPHPEVAGRGFVLLPWSLVDPGAVLPGVAGSRPVADLLARLRGPDGVLPGVRVRDDVRLRVAGVEGTDDADGAA